MYERALALVRHYFPHYSEHQQRIVARELLAELEPDHITLLLQAIDRTQAPP